MRKPCRVYAAGLLAPSAIAQASHFEIQRGTVSPSGSEEREGLVTTLRSGAEHEIWTATGILHLSLPRLAADLDPRRMSARTPCQRSFILKLLPAR